MAATILPLPTTHFPSPRASFPLFPHAPPKSKPQFFFRATADDEDDTTASDPQPASKPDSDDPFESRLSQVRLRYRSGTGKKAEMRKSKKGGATAARSGAAAGMYLPPVALKEAVSDGLKVEFGFSPYSERVNGRIAILGLTALVLVELATGKSVINYHTPAIILIQIYFVAAVSALYVKFEKEKVSVWPQNSPSNE